MINKKFIVSILTALLVGHTYAQNVDLDSLLDAEMKNKTKSATQRTEATFTTSRLINSHTLETTQAGVLDFKVSHRFGTLNQGFYNIFGFDYASMLIGADYGITNRLTVGGGRSTFEKQYNGFLKYRLLWQSSGKTNVPLSVTLLAGVMYATDTAAVKRNLDITVKPRASDKTSYVYQALIGRKFGNGFSLQFMPTMVHYNTVATSNIPNDLYSIGAGVRIKVTKMTSLTAEYYYQLSDSKLPGTYNSLSVGYEIETGGHVFQFQLSNSTGMTEKTFINETTNSWGDGGIHFGFNIARVFTIVKPKTTP
jgi:hypothetical protein